MKRVYAIIVLSGLALNLAAARIVCTTYPVWVLTEKLTRNIDNMQISLLMPADAGCAHEYAPTPQDIRKLAQAGTILVANGLQVDEHIVKLARKVNRDLVCITGTDSPGNYDVHTFASCNTSRNMSVKIAEGLSRADAKNQQQYAKNLADFTAELDALIKEFQLLPAGKTVIIQSDLFINLAALCRCRIISLRHERSTAPNSADLKKIYKELQQKPDAVIWQEKGIPDPALKNLQKRFKLKAVELDMLVTGPNPPAAEHYINVMQKNLDAIKKAWQK